MTECRHPRNILGRRRSLALAERTFDQQLQIPFLLRYVFSAAALIPASAGTGSDEPNAQMFEDVPDDRRVFDTADDPHRALTLRANQRIYFVYFLDKPRPVPP
jgi:hypothetical protein